MMPDGMTRARVGYKIFPGLLFISLLMCLSQGTPTSSGTGRQRSVHNCHSQSQRVLPLSCDRDRMLRILRTFYGYSHDGFCHYTRGDCTAEDRQSHDCVGRRTCAINAPQRSGRRLRACGRDSNYFQVDYECVPVTEVKNICNHGSLTALTGEHGFLTSPMYPAGDYNDKTTLCTTRIEAPALYEIKVFLIDLDLRENGTDCRDSLEIRQLSSVTLCGRRTNTDNHLAPSNVVEINFLASPGRGRKGFWLSYKAVKTHVVPTTSYTKEVNMQRKETDLIQDIESPTHSLDKQSTNRIESDRKPIKSAAIIGGVIGSLLFVLCLLLVLLTLRWWRERCEFQHMKQKKFSEIRNNAFQSSNEYV